MKSKLAKAKDNPRSTYWQRKALDAWRALIRLPGRCAICGRSDGQLDPHHLITRAAKSCKCKAMNGVLLCPSCHRFSTHLSAHGNPIKFAAWLQEHRPEQYRWVLDHRYAPGPVDWRADYERLVGTLRGAATFKALCEAVGASPSTGKESHALQD